MNLQNINLFNKISFYILIIFSIFFRAACSVDVINLLRMRTSGNSAGKVMSQLRESHTTIYKKKLRRFLKMRTRIPKMATAPKPIDPIPPQPSLPGSLWLEKIFCIDVFQRI